MSIFDELSEKYGIHLPNRHGAPEVADTQQIRAVPPPAPPAAAWPGWYPPPPVQAPAWRPPAPQGPPPGCPVCAERDRPQVLLHRHIDHAVESLRRQIAEMEQRMSAALDNLNSQVTNLNGTLQGTVLPALTQLGAAAASGGSGGVPEADVQAAADAVSSLTSQLAAATQQAVAQIPPAQ